MGDIPIIQEFLKSVDMFPKSFLCGKDIETVDKNRHSFQDTFNGMNRDPPEVLRFFRIRYFPMKPIKSFRPVGMGAINSRIPGDKIYFSCIKIRDSPGNLPLPEKRASDQPDNILAGIPVGREVGNLHIELHNRTS